MIGELVNKINRRYQKRLDNIVSMTNVEYDENFIQPYLIGGNDLTEDEINKIKIKWGGVIPYLKRGFRYFKALKELDRFSPDYLPSSYYFPIVETALNPKEHKFELSHKSLTDYLYKGIAKFPDTVVRKYNGMYFDGYQTPLSPKRAAELLRADEDNLIFKPAQFTVQGMGIEILTPERKTEMAALIEMENFAGWSDGDFVIQRLVPQSNATKKFNPSSLNTMRITTLNLNGKISVCSRGIKLGPIGSVVDNIGTGKKGVLVGLTEEGELMAHGFYGSGEKATSHNGVTFMGNKIPNFHKVIEVAKELHSVNSMSKIIGWDLALDENNNVVLIEGNAAHPGIGVEQMATGPIFGKRTDEVIEYVKDTLNR